MTHIKLIRRYYRTARDFVVGLAAFHFAVLAGLASPCDWLSTAAHARRFEEEPLPMASGLISNIVPASPTGSLGWSSTHHAMMFLTLAVAFATMFALNLWFARHVRRVHASSRRRG